MDIMLNNISQSLASQNIIFDPKNQRVRCFAHVINLAAKKLINSLYVAEDESSFENSEDTEDNLKDTIHKVILLQNIYIYC